MGAWLTKQRNNTQTTRCTGNVVQYYSWFELIATKTSKTKSASTDRNQITESMWFTCRCEVGGERASRELLDFWSDELLSFPLNAFGSFNALRRGLFDGRFSMSSGVGTSWVDEDDGLRWPTLENEARRAIDANFMSSSRRRRRCGSSSGEPKSQRACKCQTLLADLHAKWVSFEKNDKRRQKTTWIMPLLVKFNSCCH